VNGLVPCPGIPQAVVVHLEDVRTDLGTEAVTGLTPDRLNTPTTSAVANMVEVGNT
jgi:hypothetical protein